MLVPRAEDWTLVAAVEPVSRRVWVGHWGCFCLYLDVNASYKILPQAAEPLSFSGPDACESSRAGPEGLDLSWLIEQLRVQTRDTLSSSCGCGWGIPPTPSHVGLATHPGRGAHTTGHTFVPVAAHTGLS